jgi:non-specific serine/threonine protein kinase
MLSEPERIELRRVAVFASGFTLEAAEAVSDGDGVDSSEVLDLLVRLVDKSLVVAEEEGGTVRYRLLETVRQYGRERLRESAETEVVHRRHRDWYMGLAEGAGPNLFGAEQAAWFDRLEMEQGNLRAALMWSIENEGAEAASRLIGVLWRFWAVRGYFEEGNKWLEAVLDVAKSSRDAPPAFRAQALNAAGHLALSRGGFATARALLEESLAIRRQLGDAADVAVALSNLGTVAIHQGEMVMARTLLEEGLAIRRELGDKVGIAGALDDLGTAAIEWGDTPVGRSLLEEGLAIRRELGDKAGIAASLNNVGMAAGKQGDYAAARSLLEESVHLCQEVGDKWLHAVTLDTLGDLARAQADLAAARSRYGESLFICLQLEDMRAALYGLEGLAGVACARGQHHRAVQLFAAAAAHREAGGVPLRKSERADHDRDVAASRATLGEDVFTADWADGHKMTPAQAIEYALRDEN